MCDCERCLKADKEITEIDLKKAAAAQSARNKLCAACGKPYSIPFARPSDRAIICAGCFADAYMP